MDKEALIHFIGGAAGGTVGTAITCPLEVIKTRLQSSAMSHSRFRIFKFINDVVREEGFKALYKGLLPNLIGVAPSKAVYFYFYSSFKRFWNNSDYFVPNSAMVHMVSAGGAGFVTTTVINPIWLVKTRLQLHKGPLTVWNCVKRIYTHERFRGFYRGVTASYMGISETIIQFVLYEHFRSIINREKELQSSSSKSQENTKFFTFMIAGGAAKFCACIITYPHEVVRTRLREENSKAKGFFHTLKKLWKEGGVRSLYRGLSVQLIRSVPNTALTMGTYELLIYLLHRIFKCGVFAVQNNNSCALDDSNA